MRVGWRLCMAARLEGQDGKPEEADEAKKGSRVATLSLWWCSMWW